MTRAKIVDYISILLTVRNSELLKVKHEFFIRCNVNVNVYAY
jgi:hypothetical protein